MVIPVVQVLYSLEIGGVEKVAVTIGANLDRKRFQPAVCALDRDGVLSEELAHYGIPYHVLWRKGIEVGVLKRLYRCFRQEKARVVHTHQFAQLLFSLLPAKACGAKIVHTEHEYYLYRRDARARRIFKQLTRFCSAFTVVGPEVARYYTEELRLSSSRMHVIANAVDLDRFGVGGEDSRTGFGLSGEEVVFGIVGRLEPEKDHRTLLRAFQALIAHGQAARLLVVGDGSLRGELESQCRALDIERNVMFLGARADIPHVLAAFDVFVLSSVQEGVPLSVVEAMGAGKPVIATDIGGLRLLVKPGVNGLLVPSADPVALEKAMRELAGSAALRQQMGRQGRQLAQESFGVSTMINRYQDLYDAVLGGSDVRN
jgi:L-malate glycosyltransferase